MAGSSCRYVFLLSGSAGRSVQYFVNYTFSKVLGTTGVQDDAVIDPIDPRNRSYGVPIWDRTHIFNASYFVLVPDAIRPDGNGFLSGLLNGSAHALQQRPALHVVFTGDIVSAEVQLEAAPAQGRLLQPLQPGQALLEGTRPGASSAAE